MLACLEMHVETGSIKERETILYKYVIDKKVYKSKQFIHILRIAARDFYESNVYYNKQIPCLSYIGKKGLKLRSTKIDMCITGFFFLFIFLIYKYADMDKWIGVYTKGEYKSSRPKKK